MRKTRLLTSVAAVGVLTLAGCADDETATSPAEPTATASATEPTPSETAPSETEPSEEAPAGLRIEATIEGDSALPIAEQVEMKAGETVTLVVESDRAGELHVHSTPEQTVDFSAGTEEYQLTFDQPGTVDIEEHDTGVLLFRVLVS